jgi:hypothetical protein
VAEQRIGGITVATTAARALGCRPSCRHQQCAKTVFLNALVLDSLQPIHLGGS